MITKACFPKTSSVFECPSRARLNRARCIYSWLQIAAILMVVGLMGSSANAQLLHRYDFETAGSANDTVGTADGTIYGAATVTNGALNTVAGVTGTLSGGVPQNCVGLPASAVAGITNAFSIEVWYKANGGNGHYDTIFAFSDGTTGNYVLATPARGTSPWQSDTEFKGGGGNTGGQLANQIYCDNGTINDMVVTYDGTNVTYYLNGALPTYSGLQNTFSDPGFNLSTLTQIGIGGGSPYNDLTVAGQIYDYRIFGQALTPIQVAAMHSLGTNASNTAISNALSPGSDFVWNGGGADSNFSTGLNWVGGTAPQLLNGDFLTIAGSSKPTPNVDTNYIISSLSFSNDATSFAISSDNGSTLTIGSGGVTNNSANTQTLNVPITLPSPATFDAATGDLSVSNVISGGGGLTKTGPNTLTITGTNNATGTTSVNGGAMVMSGSAVFNGPSSTSVRLQIGNATGANAAFYQSGTSVVNLGTGGGVADLGHVPNSSGYYNLSGGSLLIPNGGELDPAGAGGGAGTFGQFDMTAGTVTVGTSASAAYFLPCRGASGESSVVNFLGGTVSFSPTMPEGDYGGYECDWAAGGQTNVTTISGTALFSSPNTSVKLNWGNNAGNIAILNLNGGTFQTLGFRSGKNTGAVVDFNGGTLKAGNSSNTGFMTGLGNAYVYGGNGTIDNNGQNITIDQALLEPNGDGVSTIAVSSGGAGYVVPPQVVITDPSGSGATAYATISGGAVTAITVTSPGNNYSTPTVTFVGGGYATTASVGAVTTTPNSSGGLTFQGSGTTTLNGVNTYTNDTIITSGCLNIGSSGYLYAGSSVGTVTVSTATASAALGGAGYIYGPVVLQASSGGNNAAISLTNGAAEYLYLYDGLTLNSGNVLNFDVASAGSDNLYVSGGTYSDSAAGPGSITVNLTPIGTGITSGGTIDLLTLPSAPDITKFTLATPPPPGFVWNLQVSGTTLQVAITQTAPAAAYWNGGVDNNWSTPDSGGNFNWATDSSGSTSTGVKPGASTAVTFATTGAANLATTLGGDLAIASLEFNGYLPDPISIGGANVLTNFGGVTLDYGTGPVTIDASGYVLGGNAILANNSSTNLTISSPVSGAYSLTNTSYGSGLTILSGNNSFTGGLTVSTGILVLSGDNTSATGATTVGASAILELQNANAVAGSVLTLNSDSTLSLRADADTTFTPASLGAFIPGSTYNFLVNALTSPAGNEYTLTLTGQGGAAAPGTTTINVSSTNSDTLKFNTSAAYAIGGNSGSAWAGDATAFNLNGADLVLNGLSQANNNDGLISLSSSTGNTLTINGTVAANNNRTLGATVNSGVLTLNNTVTANTGMANWGFFVNLNGGTLNLNNAGAIANNHSPGFTINGGSLDNTSGADVTLTANPKIAFNGDFTFQGSTNLNLGAGDVTMNSPRQITVATNTLTIGGVISDGGSGYSLNKYGNGTLALAGANTYTGGTYVYGGTLAVGSALTGTTATGNLYVYDGGKLQITESGANQLMPASLQVGSGSGATLAFANVSSTTLAPMNPTNLTVYGTLTINISSLASLTPGTYPLVTNYPGGATVTLGTLPKNVNAHLDTTSNPNQISLVVDSISVDVWANAAGGNWDTATANWKTNGVSTVYADGDPVQFDDTPGGSSIAVTNTSASVAPYNVVVTNNAVVYTISGNLIAGGTSLTKTGTGTLTLANTNTYTGGTVISNGRLQLGDGVAKNGVVAGDITDNGNLTFANPFDQTFSGAISGSGSVTKTAASGVLTMSGNNNYSGGTTLEDGSTVILPNGATNSFGSGTLTLSNATLVVQPNSGGYNDGNAVYIGNNVNVPGGTINVIDDSALNYGNLWLGGDGVEWTGTGTIKFQNSGTVIQPAVLWNASPLQNFHGTINIGATNSGYRMYNGFGYNSGTGGTGTSVATFDASGVAWQLGDVGYTLSQSVDAGLTTIKLGSISAVNTNTVLRGNNSTTTMFEVGALGTSTTFAGMITDNGSGVTALTKDGAGTLTLSGADAYTGNTAISNGTLELAQSYATLATNSTVTIAGGAHLQLTVAGVTNIVSGLVTNGIAAGNGLYNSANSSGYITGPGSLMVGAVVGPTSEPIITSYNPGTKQLTLTWTEAGWTLECQTNNPSTGLNPTTWTPVTGASSPYVITVDPSQPTVFYRLANP